MIKLPFQGVIGQSSKEVVVQVPCVEMYGDNCPILAEVRTWYKDESLKEMANKYWKKRSYLFQGFVRQNPLSEDKQPENPIRRFVISPQIFTIIKSSLMDPEIEELPTDPIHGLDFRIVKGKKGDYADYSTSGWARKESALTDVELAAIEAHGLYNLREFLPKKPSESELRIIKEMFDASVDGKPYDPDRWAAYYKPWGLQSSAPSEMDEGSTRPAKTEQPTVTKVNVPRANVTDDNDDPPFEVEKPAATKPVSSEKANDILAMIRSRQQSKVS
jgi:hypothetical protein